MTVLRREDVQSRVASWDGSPYRIASSPILAIVPLIIRRLRGPSPRRVMVRTITVHRLMLSLRRRFPCWLQGCPQKAGQLARNRHRDLRRRLVLFPQTTKATTQALLRLVRNRNHAGRLSFASPRERHPDMRPVLVVPRGFNEHSAHQRIPGARDPTAPMFLARGVLPWDEARIGHQSEGPVGQRKVVELRADAGGHAG